MPQINLYSFAKGGVNVDKTSVELNDEELGLAQNAITDPLGFDGSLRKRPGLTKVNSSAAAGSIAGSIPAPLSVGGQSVGPGGTAPASARTLWVAFALTNDTPTGWYTTTDALTTVTRRTTGSIPAVAASRQKRVNLAAPAQGRWSPNPPAGIQFNNRLYYAGNNYTLGTTAPEIKVWDGVQDRQLCTIPPSVVGGVTTQAQAIMHMCLGTNGKIYLTTYDSGTGVADYKGRVWELDTESGSLVQVGPGFTMIPNAIIWHSNRLWVGTYTGNSNTTLAKIYFFRPGIDTSWTLDFTTAASPAVHDFASYRGQLFANLEGGTSGAAPLVKVRSTLGVWTTSDTGGASSLTVYLGAVVFKNNLYVSYFNDAGGASSSLIRKYDGTSWTTAYTGTSNGITPFWFYQNNNILYAISAYGDAKTIYTTPDGSSWTDKTSLFTVGDELTAVFATILT